MISYVLCTITKTECAAQVDLIQSCYDFVIASEIMQIHGYRVRNQIKASLMQMQ